MNVMVDLNILVDVLQAREPWYGDSRAIWEAHNRGVITGYIAAHALTNLFYLMRRAVAGDQARVAVRDCLQTFEIIPVGRPELEQAEQLVGNALESNLVPACALKANLDAIVTRDPRGFPGSPMAVVAPAQFLAQLAHPGGSAPPAGNS